MKIIIAYASAGSGHFKAAEAVYNYFKSRNKNIQVDLIDTLEKSSSLFRDIYIHGYAFAVNYVPWLWALGYKITYVKYLRTIVKGIHFAINRLNTKEFTDFLIQENPDFIISTHFLPSEISAYLKRKKKINSRLLTVITDFGIHPFWISDGTDIYVAASEFTKDELILEGIEREAIKELGIPIHLKFFQRYDKSVSCKRINISENKFTVLIMTGSFGIGPIEQIVDLLSNDVQILVVCGRNEVLYERLRRKNYIRVKVFGFIDNIQELMAVSDVIITKPGGLTISEILIMELPPIFISAIPGQEVENIRILKKYGIAFCAETAKDLKDIVLNYKCHPDKLEKIRERMRKIKKPSASQELYNVICQNSAGATR